MTYKALGKRYGFTLDTPVKDFSKEALHALLYGTGDERIEMQRESMFGSGTYFNQFEGIIRIWSAASARRAASGSRRKLPLSCPARNAPPAMADA